MAKLPEGATKQQFREMVQNLLAERFDLKLHKESREFPAFELVVAKGGPKLEGPHTPPGGDFPELPGDRPGMASRQNLSGGYVLVGLRARQ